MLITVKRRLAAIFSILVLATSLSGCGEEPEASDAEDPAAEIERVIIANQTGAGDPEIECVETVTESFADRMFDGVEQCRTSIEENAEKAQPAENVEVSAVDIDGSAATARVALRGGDFDGASGSFELVESDGQWRIEGFDDEFARTSIEARLNTSVEDTGLEVEGVRCAQQVLGADLAGDGAATDYFTALVGGDEAAVQKFQDAVLLCQPIEVGETGSAERDEFENSYYEYFTGSEGISEQRAGCILGQLRIALSEQEIGAWTRSLAAGDGEPQTVLTKVQTSALNCASVK